MPPNLPTQAQKATKASHDRVHCNGNKQLSNQQVIRNFLNLGFICLLCKITFTHA